MPDNISRLLKDEVLRRRLSANGRRVIEEQYSWAQVASQYEKLFEQLS